MKLSMGQTQPTRHCFCLLPAAMTTLENRNNLFHSQDSVEIEILDALHKHDLFAGMFKPVTVVGSTEQFGYFKNHRTGYRAGFYLRVLIPNGCSRPEVVSRLLEAVRCSVTVVKAGDVAKPSKASIGAAAAFLHALGFQSFDPRVRPMNYLPDAVPKILQSYLRSFTQSETDSLHGGLPSVAARRYDDLFPVDADVVDEDFVLDLPLLTNMAFPNLFDATYTMGMFAGEDTKFRWRSEVEEALQTGVLRLSTGVHCCVIVTPGARRLLESPLVYTCSLMCRQAVCCRRRDAAADGDFWWGRTPETTTPANMCFIRVEDRPEVVVAAAEFITETGEVACVVAPASGGVAEPSGAVTYMFVLPQCVGVRRLRLRFVGEGDECGPGWFVATFCECYHSKYLMGRLQPATEMFAWPCEAGFIVDRVTPTTLEDIWRARVTNLPWDAKMREVPRDVVHLDVDIQC